MQQTLEQLDAAIKRWNTKLTIAHNRLKKLHQARSRALRRGMEADHAKARRVTQEASYVTPVECIEAIDASSPPPFDPVPDNLDIPTFLARDPNEVALDKLKARQAERDTAKRPSKAKPLPRHLAKAIAERDAIAASAKQ